MKYQISLNILTAKGAKPGSVWSQEVNNLAIYLFANQFHEMRWPILIKLEWRFPLDS